MSAATPTMTPARSGLLAGHLPRWVQPALLVLALVVGAAVWLPFGGPGWIGWAVATMVV